MVPKNFVLKKDLFEKILVQNFFGTNKIFDLKILGPKKFQIWKKIGVKKDNVEKKKFKAKINFGSGKFF